MYLVTHIICIEAYDDVPGVHAAKDVASAVSNEDARERGKDVVTVLKGGGRALK